MWRWKRNFGFGLKLTLSVLEAMFILEGVSGDVEARMDLRRPVSAGQVLCTWEEDATCGVHNFIAF